MADARAPSPPYPHGALPVGARLGEFEVRRVLGVGGFGIVYLAFDHLLEREVALKEYMPATLVDRAETMHVSLVSHEHADTFALGLRSFVNEARLLARFDHPSLVKVHRFWEANGTAYMAMALYRGRTAREVRLAMPEPPGEAWLRSVLEPLLGAIERLHAEDVFHRDIAPDNILIEGDGRPVLLDFGAARRVITDRSQTLTAILKPSYAPIEQYADAGGLKQGAWTDLYALGATMHFLLLGKPPLPAPGRTIQDTMKPLAQQTFAGVSTEFLALIDWMLAPMPGDRPQNVAAVRDALAGRVTPPPRARGAAPAAGRADDTLVLPRSGLAATPGAAAPAHDAPYGDDATVVMPRRGAAGAAQPPIQPPVQPPWQPHAAAQAHPQALPQSAQPQSAQARPQAHAPASAPAHAPAHAPTNGDGDETRATSVSALHGGAGASHAPQFTEAQARPRHASAGTPPPAAAARPTARAGWASALAGVGVAVALGGLLWWVMAKPGTTPTQSAAAPVASAAVSAPAPAPEPVTTAPTAALHTAPTTTAAAASTPAASVGADPAPSGSPAVAVVPTPVVQAPPVSAVARPEPAPPARATAPGVEPRAAARAPTTPAARAAERSADPRVAGSRAGSASAGAPATAAHAGSVPPAPVQAPPSQASPPAAPVASGAAPGAAEPARARSPSERCASEPGPLKALCIDFACNRSEFTRHPECVKLRAEQANKRYLEGN